MESERQGRKVTQREFVLGLIENALQQAADAAPDDIPTPAEDQEAYTKVESENRETIEGGNEDAAE